MNAWLVAAIALLPGLVACGALIFRASLPDAIVALNMAGTLATLELALLSEGLARSPFYDLALVLAALTFSSGLVFARYLGRWL